MYIARIVQDGGPPNETDSGNHGMSHLNCPPSGASLRLESQVLCLALGRHPTPVAGVEEQEVPRAVRMRCCSARNAECTCVYADNRTK